MTEFLRLECESGIPDDGVSLALPHPGMSGLSGQVQILVRESEMADGASCALLSPAKARTLAQALIEWADGEASP